MKVRFYLDPDTRNPHIFKHRVSEEETFAFFTNKQYFEFQRKDQSFEAFGKTLDGRLLQFAFRKERDGSIFIITGYDIEDKEMILFLEENL